MTLEIQTPEAAQSTSTLPQLEEEQEFNWRHCWYPIAFVQDLPKNRPYSFSLYDEPFSESASVSADRQSALSDRFSRHTQICSSCNRAYQVTNRLKQVSVGVAIALGALTIVTDHSWHQIVAMSLSLSAAALAAIAQTQNQV